MFLFSLYLIFIIPLTQFVVNESRFSTSTAINRLPVAANIKHKNKVSLHKKWKPSSLSTCRNSKKINRITVNRVAIQQNYLILCSMDDIMTSVIIVITIIREIIIFTIKHQLNIYLQNFYPSFKSNYNYFFQVFFLFYFFFFV